MSHPAAGSENSHPCSVALALIDVINDFDFPEAPQLLQQALPMASQIAALKVRAQQARIPVIYVNDNFGRWRSDFRTQVQHCLRDDCLGRDIARQLQPDEDDYFILKPRHSGFFATPLDILLRHLEVKTVILTGVATNICVLFTAHDAYMRGFKVIVPRDCSAANTENDHAQALEIMTKACKAETLLASELDLESLLGEA